VFDPRPLSESP